MYVTSAIDETLLPRSPNYSSNAVFAELLLPSTNPSRRHLGRTDEPTIDPVIVARFLDLKHQWKLTSSQFASGPTMFLHPAYQMIIGMGKQVLPLILRELEHQLDHWFWALKAIAGVDPCAERIRGNLPAMCDAWMNWARTENIRW